ncbi:MAG: alpha/beta hydrolase [Betaproteobacteria bacterium]|nr:alpha/beta hydrolase [Betaproteobacteria bacterium]
MTSVSAKSHTIVRDDVKLHHLDWGNEGEHPIVLVHGSRLHAHVWNHFSSRFKDRFHIIAIDQRGHGDSGWCRHNRYDLEDFYQDLRAVIQARGLSRYTLIGHSLGGRVSMLYASRHQQELARLVLVDITPGRPAATADADRSRVTETPAPREFESQAHATAYLGKLLSRAPAHLIEESVRYGMRRLDSGRYTWKYDPAVLKRAPAALDLWSMVQSISTPTLLQYGSHSNVVSPELAQRLSQTMPRCDVERIDNAGHALFTDQPDAFAASVERFLKS